MARHHDLERVVYWNDDAELDERISASGSSEAAATNGGSTTNEAAVTAVILSTICAKLDALQQTVNNRFDRLESRLDGSESRLERLERMAMMKDARPEAPAATVFESAFGAKPAGATLASSAADSIPANGTAAPPAAKSPAAPPAVVEAGKTVSRNTFAEERIHDVARSLICPRCGSGPFYSSSNMRRHFNQVHYNGDGGTLDEFYGNYRAHINDVDPLRCGFHEKAPSGESAAKSADVATASAAAKSAAEPVNGSVAPPAAQTPTSAAGTFVKAPVAVNTANSEYSLLGQDPVTAFNKAPDATPSPFSTAFAESSLLSTAPSFESAFAATSADASSPSLTAESDATPANGTAAPPAAVPPGALSPHNNAPVARGFVSVFGTKPAYATTAAPAEDTT
jgi:hypothetical protein